MLPPPFLPPSLAAMALGLSACGYALAQAGLLVYSSHRFAFLSGGRMRPVARPAPPGDWPAVTVQLPVYNEPAVVERLIDAVAALDYPRDRLDIQVLDDSDDARTDGTLAIAAATIARHRARGVVIEHVRRDTRRGYKAGALAHGMARSSAPLIAILDADFVPAPQFLRELVPHFADDRVGMVQARWGHLERDASWLTRAQATMLDAHFLLEQTVRQSRGLFFNFNGTAGVWRRACIEAAGGWSHDTLTEDLDLSYRAQAAGWRFVYDRSVVVPAELPADMWAFQVQQRRWATGAVQTARKLLPGLLSSPLPDACKLEAVLHLTANLSYPLLLLLSSLLWPVLAAPRTTSALTMLLLQATVILLGVAPVFAFLVAGQRAAGRSWRAALFDGALALVLGLGSAPNNARAVWTGWRSRGGVFERTPKRGRVAHTLRGSGARVGRVEAVLSIASISLLAWAASQGHVSAVPFLAMLSLGLTWVATAPWVERTKARRVSGGPHAMRRAGVATAGRSSATASP